MRDAIQHVTETIPTRDHYHSAVVLAAAVLTDAAEGRDLFDCIRIILDHFSPIARALRGCWRPARPSIPEAAVMESKSRGVLDRPVPVRNCAQGRATTV